jgi:RNA polymerase sigma-70 factor (ECF subfamily)
MREISKSAATDLELVKAIKNENKAVSEKAFNELYKKYHDSMLFHFKGLVKDEEVAQELVMEAFMKVNVNLEKFNHETAVFSTWLFKLTQNLFIDRMRKKKEDVMYLSDMATYDEESRAIEYEIASTDSTPENKMLVSERNRKINEIINSMENKELSKVIKMRFFEGMSYEEISMETGKPLGTVKAFIFRAKIILRKEFENAYISM